MKTINSISGGKSSAFMAIHNNADLNVFCAVLTNDKNTIINDNFLRNYCKDKIPSFDWNRGGCRELDLTLLNLVKLEQKIGRRIDWVSAPFTFDELIRHSMSNPDAATHKTGATNGLMLPNARSRLCTLSLKIYPCFWYSYLNSDEELPLMNIGFRWDEQKRVNNWNCKNNKIKVPLRCDITGRYRGKHRHTELEWRNAVFPLYNDRVTRDDIDRYFDTLGWDYPVVSNCDYCFFHRKHQQIEQYKQYPDRANWWVDFEIESEFTFGKSALIDILDDVASDHHSAGSSCLCSD
jgi:hypothetical protein